MKNNSEKRGLEGELIAQRFLKLKGYLILDRNWRFRKFEVDIIAQHEGMMIFIEVKSRKNSTFGDPEIFVNRKKQNFLIKAAHQYLTQNNINLESRFDIISVLNAEEGLEVKHIEGAFSPNVK
jgi:putative endonuclease